MTKAKAFNHQHVNEKFFTHGNNVIDNSNDLFDLSFGNITSNNDSNNLERIRPRTDILPYKPNNNMANNNQFQKRYELNKNDLPLMSELLLANTEHNKNSILHFKLLFLFLCFKNAYSAYY